MNSLRRVPLVLLYLALTAPATRPARSDEVDATEPGVVRWTIDRWPGDGVLVRPGGVGNITAAYFAHDAQRAPIVVEFNSDASRVHLHGPAKPPSEGATILLETAEKSGAHAGGRIVFSALDAEVVGSRAKLETHPGNHRIGFWSRAEDYVRWPPIAIRPGEYDVELTYSTASPDGTEMEINLGGKSLPVTLKTTGSWYKYTTVAVGRLRIAEDGSPRLTVRCRKKVGAAAINLKAVTLRPAAKAGD